ncbi:helix-turn-helix domain-containing protein [Nocardioides thalensis]|nr:helix-turn-helix domain-containing protein [Nocardioides thalensis]
MTDDYTDHSDHSDDIDPRDSEGADRDPVEVRRNLWLSASIGLLSALLAAAFAVRAFQGGELVDWVGLTVLGVIALVHLATVVDSRAPLLVADGLGVRLRDGNKWQGLAWDEIECLEHLPRRGLFRDGHVLVVGHDDRQLIVPLTLATTLAGADRAGLSDALADLAGGRTDVVEVVPGLGDDDETPGPDAADGADDPVQPDPQDGEDAGPEPMRLEVDDIATGEMDAVTDAAAPTVLPARLDPPRSVVRDAIGHLSTIGANALRREPAAAPTAGLPEEELLRRTDDDEGTESTESTVTVVRHDDEPEELTVVLADVSVQPADEPVIGPQLAAARERLRLSVDQLADRTRVRPHVIESIEVDDFGPCGGDFYARGHLRTLGRVLGVDSAPLVAAYDERYADAPVDPRRVFASELATGAGGSIRGTRGGRNWSVLVAAVMAAVLVWSVARLVMDGPVQIEKPPVLNQSGGPNAGMVSGKIDPIDVTLTAAGGGAQVVVRDADGDIVFDGSLAFQQSTELQVVPPVRVWSSDGSVTASVAGEEAAPLGEIGAEVNKTLVAP